MGNPERFIPFSMNYNGSFAVGMPSAMMRYLLVKTGDIPAGTHSINQLVARASTDRGAIFDLNFTATVTVAGCSMPAAPGNQINVPMGTWEKRVFNGKGSTSPAQSFAITLNACIAGNKLSSKHKRLFFSTTMPLFRSTPTKARRSSMRLTASSVCRVIPQPRAWPSRYCVRTAPR